MTGATSPAFNPKFIHCKYTTFKLKFKWPATFNVKFRK